MKKTSRHRLKSWLIRQMTKKKRSRSRTVVYLLLLLTFLWAFLGTIDGPVLTSGTAAASVGYKTPNVLDWRNGGHRGPLWIRVFLEEPPPVHVSFLLFDFKQNLRRWPNVAGDINRSPPIFLVI